MSDLNPATSHLLYEVDDNPPLSVSLPLAGQTIALILAGITLTPIIALTAAGIVDVWGNWVVFAALAISGVTTILQARPIGNFGAGYVLFMGTSGAFLAVSISALEAGGLPLLGSLVLVSALIQFLFAAKLSLFREVINPTVGGTVVCLIAVTVMPIGFNMVSTVPEGFDTFASAPAITAIVTLVVILLLSFYTAGKTRLWAPLVGVVVGFLVAWPLNLTDLSGVSEASWVGLPDQGWPGLNTDFDTAFWALLPSFVIVTIIGALETFGDGIAIQDISSKKIQTTDYRVVQGAVNADGLGNFLSGLAGTLPNTTYSTSISVVDLTGVASRKVGLYGGIILLGLAFIPKLSALLQAIPTPVAGAFIIVFLVLLFSHGIRLVMSEGMSFDNGIVFGLALWLGIGFQNQQLFNGLLPDYLASLLNNGMTAGGIAAVFLSWLVSLKNKRQARDIQPLDRTGLAGALAFVTEEARESDWRGEDLNRLALVVEEAFVYMMTNTPEGVSELELRIRAAVNHAEIELRCGETTSNVETQLRNIDTSEKPEDLGLKVLKYMTDDLKHQQFSNGEFLILRLNHRATPTARLS